MKKGVVAALLCAMLALAGLARAEDAVYVSPDGCFHATPLCALARADAEEYARLAALAAGEGEQARAAEVLLDAYYPRRPLSETEGCACCPVCVQDGTDYGGPTAVERGGTLVLRLSDAWIASRSLFSVFGVAGDETLTGQAALTALANCLHGDAYASFIEAALVTGAARADALCPDVWLDPGELRMHIRHIGGAWYLALRPGEDARRRMKKDGRARIEARLEGGQLVWSNGALTKASWGLRCEETLDLKLASIDGRPVFSGDFESLRVALFREMDANILVVRESPGAADWLDGAVLTLDDRPAAEGLCGYMDGDDAVYVCVLSDPEADALKRGCSSNDGEDWTGAFPRLTHPGRVTAEAVDDDGWRLEYVSEAARTEQRFDYTVFFRDNAIFVTNNSDAECRPITVRFQSARDGAGDVARLDAVPPGGTLRVFDAGHVEYCGNGETELCAWCEPTQPGSGEIISNYDRVWGAYIDGRLTYVHTPLDDDAALSLFIDDAGAVYVRNNTGEPLPGARLSLSAVEGIVDWPIAAKAPDLPAGQAALAWTPEEVAAALRSCAPPPQTVGASCDPGAEAGASSGPLRWSAALYGGVAPAQAETAAENGLPGPGRDLSFLSDYADATRVGDWYLACTGGTGEGRRADATRNDSANWVLLDGSGRVLADGLRWWPEDDDWPLQPRPFEGFEDGADAAVIRVGQKYGLIDRAGAIVAQPIYDNIFNVLPGYPLIPAERDGKWGCLDTTGREAIPFIYDQSFARFEGGLTEVVRDGRHALLREDGVELLPAVYDDIWLEDGAQYGMAHRGDVCALFDRDGRILFEKALSANSWIYCRAGTTPPFPYSDGRDESYGFIDLDGAVVPGGPYTYALPFDGSGDTAGVEKDGRWMLVRRDGSVALETDCEWFGGFSEGLAAAQKGDLYGYIDARGETAIPFRFSDAQPFHGGYADACPAGDPELHGLIDRSGDWVVEPRYSLGVSVGADGVAVGCGADAIDCYRLTDGVAEPIDALGRERQGLAGYLPNEDGGRLATLDEAPTLKKRASDAERLPHLDGVRRLYPLYAAFAQAVYPKDTRYQVWNSYRDDGNPVLTDNEAAFAWDRLSEGDADVIFVPAPGPDDPIWATLAARGQQPEFTPLCRDALVFPVNADNPVAEISAAQLREIYAGELASWDALGVEGLGDIVAYQGEDGGDSAAALSRLLPLEARMPAPEGVIFYEGWEAAVVTGPVEYRNLPNAIGCATRHDCRALVEGGEARLLRVDGVAPTDEALESGAYPWTETLYAVRLKGNDNPNVVALLEWIRSGQGAELIRRTGFALP